VNHKMGDKELYDTIRRAVEDALEKHRKQFAEVAFVFFLFWFGSSMWDWVSYAPWMNKLRYSIWYSVDDSQVIQTDKKPPSDCDFLKAPIGNKGCQYKKHVEVDEPSNGNGNKRSVFVYWSKEED
jgi:hypothetical protein